jgi:hypothetical protein
VRALDQALEDRASGRITERRPTVGRVSAH